MTPEEFEAQVRQIRSDLGGDIEMCHGALDDLMENLLTELGYGEGIKLIEQTDRWYA